MIGYIEMLMVLLECQTLPKIFDFGFVFSLIQGQATIEHYSPHFLQLLRIISNILSLVMLLHFLILGFTTASLLVAEKYRILMDL